MRTVVGIFLPLYLETGIGVFTEKYNYHPLSIEVHGMSKIRPTASFGLGSTRPKNSIVTKNHYTEHPPEVMQKISSMQLQRVAGNVYACPSDRDFWQVQGNKIIKLVGSEIDTGQSIPAASDTNPASSLKNFLGDLEF
jgi:hypothetical protein